MGPSPASDKAHKESSPVVQFIKYNQHFSGDQLDVIRSSEHKMIVMRESLKAIPLRAKWYSDKTPKSLH